MHDNEQQFDAEIRALIEKRRAKDRFFDLDANEKTGSYLILPGPSQDVVQRQQQDAPPPSAEESEEEKLRRVLERYKNAVAQGVFSEWLNCSQADGVAKLHQKMEQRWAAKNKASKVKLSELNQGD